MAHCRRRRSSAPPGAASSILRRWDHQHRKRLQRRRLPGRFAPGGPKDSFFQGVRAEEASGPQLLGRQLPTVPGGNAWASRRSPPSFPDGLFSLAWTSVHTPGWEPTTTRSGSTRSWGITYPLGYSVDASPLQLYKVQEMPTTLFLTATGQVTDHVTGIMTEDQLRSRIQQKLLGAA